MKFLDQAKIHISSGKGGDGCVSFRREKYIEFGGPDGGNGGKGGDIIFETSESLNTLIDFRYQQHFKAKTGGQGKGKNMTGAKAKDLNIKVPPGTQILSEDKSYLLQEMLIDKEKFILARGGKGGLGNNHFKSSTNRAPRESTRGESGTEMWIWLSLKLLADVGIIGLPNAGKSTLLSNISSAQPKIADYPFTTLHPILGVVRGDSFEFVVADIPGLIKGAHEGRGLGDKFLAHIERCKILLHLVDINSDDSLKDYATIRSELKKYNKDLTNKKEIVALSKCDHNNKNYEEVEKAFSKKTKCKILKISNRKKNDLKQLIYTLKKELHNI